jgi:hypothetical protein
LSVGEKELWTEIEPILVELLDELKASGKIEISFAGSEKQHLKNVLDNLTQVSKNYNLVLHLFDNVERFLKVNSEFGLGDKELTNLYVETTVLLSILNTELFKTLLLFHLKSVNHKPSQLNSTMGQFAPIAWRKLKPYVDSDFRNSLAHGTWALENKQVVLFEDAKLVPYEKLDLGEFIIKTKKQNVLFQCLVNVLASKHKANFFT